jgi:quercetin dioxygenase-like cupin family protein
MDDNYREAALWRDKNDSWHEVMPGVRRRIVNHSSTGMMAYYEIKAGTVFPAHNHPHAQFGMILGGQGTFKVGDKSWDLKKGDGYFIPPGVLHELKTSGTEPFLAMDFFTPERGDFLAEALKPDE